MDKIEVLDKAIMERRSVYPHMFNDEKVPDTLIAQVLEMAKYAPSHRLTQPWRFTIITGAARQRLSTYLGNYYTRNTPKDKYSEIKYKKTIAKPLQSSHIIAICLKRDEEESVPEWEEIASLAMAVQNIWLSLSARGIGCYWSTPKSMVRENKFLELEQSVRCLGIMYVGYPRITPSIPPRDDMDAKIEWIVR